MSHSNLNIVDRYPNGQFIAEFEGTPRLTSDMIIELPIRKYGKQFTTGFGTSSDYNVPKGKRVPFAFGNCTAICAGTHPNHGTIAIRVKHDDDILFDGKPYRVEVYRNEYVRFVEREHTDLEIIDRIGEHTQEEIDAAYSRNYAKRR